jgi:hypothetical protein
MYGFKIETITVIKQSKLSLNLVAGGGPAKSIFPETSTDF